MQNFRRADVFRLDKSPGAAAQCADNPLTREEVTMIRPTGYVILVAAICLAAAVPALAHHSFAAEFDGSKTFVVKGVLSKLDWTNPHVYLYLDVKGSSGKSEEYAFSSGPPTALRRSGIKKADFKIGETVTITGAPAKDGTKHLGWLKQIKYADGHVFVYRDGSE
jgi:hypothetical protein